MRARSVCRSWRKNTRICRCTTGTGESGRADAINVRLTPIPREPTPIVDADNNVLLLLGGFPDTPTWQEDVAVPAAAAMQHAAVEIYSEPRWRRRAHADGPVPRRGPHAAKHVGPAMGGGQRYPQNLAHSVLNLAIFASLFATKAIERIVGWTNMLFMAFAPDLHEFYRTNLDQLCEWDRRQTHAKHIIRNFAANLSVFAVATFNFGPATVTFPHIDFANLAWGWCAITALGKFDPNLGGHLILWDLRLIIRFPPGSTILIPSAILRHSNTCIRRHETRFSFTQFTPAGLFRWVYNDFRTDKDIDANAATTDAEHQRRRGDRERRWREGVKMYSKWNGAVRSI
ncbi:hypothetical protein C8R43DRAFT_900789 [Mycena crocata]|nr:hypothetical protein C8R43DRAFT_900789 [Mycena crocata]